MNIKAPRGTKDISILESYKWQYIEKNVRDLTALYGYREIRTPIFEHTELFDRGVGDTTDVVQKEMYTFLDKGGRSITLRPEGTAGAVRSFIESGIAAGPQPTKIFYLSAPVFRYENPQAGRLREHHQFGVEVFGAQDASIDAEIISLAWSLLHKLGVENLSLNINSIGCKHCRPEYNKALRAYYTAHKAELCDTCLDRLERNPLRLLDCKNPACAALAADAPKITDYLCPECEAHFGALQSYLGKLNIPFAVNPKIVRGLDYYTKTVFEIISSEIGAQGTVCGGGRYDGLVEEIGGPSIPAVGFGMGIERVLMLLDNLAEGECKLQIEDETPQVFVACLNKELSLKAFTLMESFRQAGLRSDMDHQGRSLKAQFKYADKLGAKYMAILGDDEAAKGVVKLRDMATKEEWEEPLTEAPNALKFRLFQ